MLTGTGLQTGGRIVLPFFAMVLAALLGFVVWTNSQVYAQEAVPTVPSLVISDITTTTASVGLNATAGCDIEAVVLEYRQDTSGPYTSIASGVCADLVGDEYALTGLTANTEYYVRVSAALTGSTITTDVVTAFTTDPIAQSRVTNITFSNITTTAATATFTFNTVIAGDLVWYRYQAVNGSWACGAQQTLSSTTKVVTISGLTPNTTYNINGIHVGANSSNCSPTLFVWGDASVFSASFTTVALPNNAPTASASAIPTTVHQGGTVALTGVASDVDAGDILTYAWASSAGGTFSSTTILSPTWVAPTVARDTSITLTLTVNDGTISTSATVTVSVTANHAPTASVLATPTTVNQGETVTLTGTASDVDSGDTLTYTWTSSAGGQFSSTTALSPSWVAPTVSSDTSITLKLTVNDGTVNTSATVTVTVAVIVSSAPQAPTGLMLSVGFTTIDASWTAPTNTGTASISGYHLQYRIKGAPSWSSIDLSTTGTSHSIPSLTSGTNYQVQVAAKNSVGTGPYSGIKEVTTVSAEGPWSAEVTETTTVSGNVPDVPTALALTPADGQLGVSWTAPTNNGGSAITGYSVQYRTGSGNWSDWPHGGTATTATITGLTNGTAYQVRVRTVNKIGNGSWSNSVVGTPAGLPAAPAAPTLAESDQQLTVTWISPVNNGAAITGYDVQYRAGDRGDFTAHTHVGTTASAVITGLTNGQSYQVEVRARNSQGAGPYSDATAGIPFNAPGIPVATVAARNESILLLWAAPIDTGGYPITHYRLVIWPVATPAAVTYIENIPAADTSYTFTGLTNGVEYSISIRAHTAKGESAWHAFLLAIPKLDPPGIPTVLTLVSGNTKLKVSWTAPDDDGGSPLTGYNVQYRLATVTGVTWPSWPHTDTEVSTTITGLTNNLEYRVRVAAVSANGTSEYVYGTATPAVDVPGIPTAVAAAVADAQLQVSWAAPTDNGGTSITGYSVQYRAASTEVWTDWSHTGVGVSAAITGLTNGQSYVVQIAALNTQGAGGYASVTATPATTPDAPDDFVTTPGIAEIGLSWSAPVNNGGRVLTGYSVQYRPGTGGNWVDWTHNDLGTTATITGLTNNLAYSVQVAAINSIGTGTYATATADAGLGTIVVSSVAVTSVTATTARVTGTLNRSEATQTVYLRYRTPISSGTWSASETTTTTDRSAIWDLTGLTHNSQYEAEVSNDAGFADSVTTAPFTTTQIIVTVTVGVLPGDFPTGNAATVTAGFTGLPEVSTLSWTYRLDVTNAGGTAFNNCEGTGMGSVIALGTINEATESRIGVTSTNCMEGDYKAVASISMTGMSVFATGEGVFTVNPPPSVSAVSVGSLSETSAPITVTIANPSGSTTAYLRHKIRTGNTWSSTEEITGSGSSLTTTLVNLSPASNYEVEASVNSNFPVGETESADFTTATPAPYVTALSASNPSLTGASLQATMAYATNSFNVYFRYRLVGGSWVVVITVPANSNTANLALTGLASGRSYEAQASTTLNFAVTGTVTFGTQALAPTPTPFPTPGTPQPSSPGVRVSGQGYLGSVWMEVGVDGDASGYLVNDFGNIASGQLPGDLFVDGIPRPMERFILHDVSSGDDYISFGANLGNVVANHQTGDALRWLRMQIRTASGEIVAIANLWDTYSGSGTCPNNVICLDLLAYEPSSLSMASLQGELVAVDFVDGATEIESAMTGGSDALTIFAEWNSSESHYSCVSTEACYISGNYPTTMITEHTPDEWKGNLTLTDTTLTLETLDANPFLFQGWKYYAVNIRGRDDALLAHIRISEYITTQTDTELIIAIPSEYAPIIDLDGYDQQVLSFQFENIYYVQLLERTPGGVIAAQLLLALIVGIIGIVGFWKAQPMIRTMAGLIGASLGAVILPIIGTGNVFWTFGIVVLVLLSCGAVYFLRSR